MEHKGIEVKLQDLLESTEDIIGHQTNTKGVMGSGVAKAIKEKYPETMGQYKSICKEYEGDTRLLLGKVQVIECENGKILANLFGQDDYSRGVVQTETKKLRKSLETLKVYMQIRELTLAIPYKIGCGLGGGNWEEVSAMISDVFEGMEESVVYYKK